jgi:uncharacterized protein (TIGR00251 family)
MRSIARRQRTAAAGVAVRVHAKPKSARDGVAGMEETPDGPVLKVRVRAVAEDGQANKAIAKVVADWLGLPKSRVTVSAGAKSRFKTLSVAGDAAELERRIAERVALLAGK